MHRSISYCNSHFFDIKRRGKINCVVLSDTISGGMFIIINVQQNKYDFSVISIFLVITNDDDDDDDDEEVLHFF